MIMAIAVLVEVGVAPAIAVYAVVPDFLSIRVDGSGVVVAVCAAFKLIGRIMAIFISIVVGVATAV
jgi:hypothetical protein